MYKFACCHLWTTSNLNFFLRKSPTLQCYIRHLSNLFSITFPNSFSPSLFIRTSTTIMTLSFHHFLQCIRLIIDLALRGELSAFLSKICYVNINIIWLPWELYKPLFRGAKKREKPFTFDLDFPGFSSMFVLSHTCIDTDGPRYLMTFICKAAYS